MLTPTCSLSILFRLCSTLLDVFETDEEIQLVTEYCPGGELFDAIQKKRNRSHAMRRGQYSEAQAACITTQILRALEDLHAADIVHRDVKPENILLADNDDSAIHVKLCDFGIARSLFRKPSTDSLSSDGEASPLTPGRSRAYSSLGSDYYVAPEMCYGAAYGTAVDIYSLGVTVYILLCGFPPVFSGSETDAAVMFPNSYWKDISDDAKDLVRRMLTPDPAARITCREALRDNWITSWNRDSGGDLLSSHVCRMPVVNADLDTKRQVNLDLVRSRLYNSLTAAKDVATKKRSFRNVGALVAKKRARSEKSTRASSALMALADLYRGVTTSSTSAAAMVASGDEKEGEPRRKLETRLGEDEKLETSFASPLTALSV